MDKAHLIDADCHHANRLPQTLDAKQWNGRLHRLHQQLYCSEMAEFDEVMTCIYQPPEGFVLADHCIVRHDDEWHLFYVTGPIAHADEWIAHIRAGRFEEARRRPYEQGDAHAIGAALTRLQHKGLILQEPQGEFAMALQGTSNLARFKDHWVNVYTCRGPGGQSLGLARTSDLEHWTLDPRNPIWRPPQYARPGGICKNVHLIRHPDDGRYLIYYCLTLCDGCSAVAMLATFDFIDFEDHGPVFKMPHQLRGTQGVESPCVVLRDGMWHLFFGCGPGVWHVPSASPDGFMHAMQGNDVVSTGGAYLLGRYHAVEVFEYHGRWFMTSTRKEQHRYLNRKAGILKFRGSAADEAATLDGLFIAEINWRGDQPIITRIAKDNVP